MSRVAEDQFRAYITTGAEKWLSSIERAARAKLERGEPLESVYCWFYDLCMRCRQSAADHIDYKCPFAPTEFEPP